MDSIDNEKLLEQFWAYLDTAHSDGVPLQAEQQTDLFSLFVELAALRNEVKLESRQVKTALDQFRDVFSTLEDSQRQLTRELDSSHGTLTDLRAATLRPLLLELLELRDRLEAGLQVFENHRPSLLAGLCRRETRLIGGLKEGQEMSLRRLEQLLQTYQVKAIEARGKPLDPHTMRAAEVEHRNDVGNGVVTEELRKGFTWDGELLRAAEVKVNKQAVA